MYYDASLKRDWDNHSALETAKQDGKHEQALETARKMKLKDYSIEEIIEMSGLSAEEIEEI